MVRTPDTAAGEQIAAARRALSRGDLAALEQHGRAAIARGEDPAEAMYLLGLGALQAGEVVRAGEWFEAAAAQAPARADCRARVAQCLSLLMHHPDAARHADKAWALGPATPAILDLLGEVFLRADQPEKALACCRQALDNGAAGAETWYRLATAARYLGDFPQAREGCARALAADPDFYRAWSMQAELTGKEDVPDRVETLRARMLALRPDQAEASLHIGFALARALETRGDHGGAIEAYEASKQPLRTRVGYRFARDAALFRALTGLFASGAHFENAAEGFRTRQPLFIMGMPRTGTTLVERMLARHPGIASGGELHQFGILLQRALGGEGLGIPGPDALASAMTLDFPKLGADYQASVAHLAGDSDRFINKLPHNFLYAGFIAMALPGAQMICLRRNAMDTCLANFRQLFAADFPWYYYNLALADTARYYVGFHNLLVHWQQVMPGRILEVEYERLVADPERELRRVLAFCGLEWDPACLDFTANAAPVTTASAVQVRKPLNADAVGRWRDFAPWLATVEALLDEAGIPVRDP